MIYIKITDSSQYRVVKKNSIIAMLVLLIVLTLPVQIQAVEKVISNSADWQDVYSSMVYASTINRGPGLFLTSTKHGTVLLNSLSKRTNGTLILSSKSKPYVVNYKAVMESQGYQDVQEISSSNINLELAKKLNKENGINKFIIIDDAYGYNALSTAQYAIIDKYYVIFANERNIGTIDSFLTDARPQKLILFGQVDEVVKTRLTKYNPEIINTGDRFDNNIEMVKRFLAIKNTRQTLMSNGEFIEASIISGQDPVIYIGRNSVPTQIKDYIKKSDFQVAVLIGNELINSATAIRRELGISVFVKFAQGARNPEGSIAQVEDLDKFPMPSYTLDLQLFSILYNKATNQLWVTYRNNAGIGTYLLGTISLASDGQTKGSVGETNGPVFIDKNQYKTFIYNLADQNITLDGQNISAKIRTLFGEGKRSLEYVLEGTFNIESVQILDDSLINITNVEYDKNKQRFLITVQNIGKVDTYVNIELLDIYINGELVTVSANEPKLLKPGQSYTFSVDAKLSEEDVKNNPIVKVKAYYGERQNSLIKSVYGEYAFKYTSADIVFYVLVALVIILLLLIILGRKKCPHCGAKNNRIRRICRKCGQPLYRKQQ